MTSTFQCEYCQCFTGCFKSSFRFFVRLNFTNYNKKPFVKLSMLLITHLTLNNWNIGNQNVFLYIFWHFLRGEVQNVRAPKACLKSHISSSTSVLGAASLYVVSSTIIQMVSRGFTSREFAGRSSFGIKLANPSDTMLAWSVHRLFLFKAFQLFLVTYPHTVVLETLIDNVKLKFFYFYVLWNYYAYTNSFFDNISHTVCEKTAIHSLVCFRRSLLLTTCSVVVQTSPTIWQFFFFWLDDQKTIKIDAWALAQTM